MTNTGSVDSGAIVLVYFVPSSPGGNNPLKTLVSFGNIEMIKSKLSQSIQMKIYPEFDTSAKGTYVAAGVC